MAAGGEQEHRYAVDIRVFVSVIVIAMALSFGVGVGLGPTAHDVAMSTSSASQLPSVTSVEMAEADEFAGKSDDLHEPAGQVSDAWMRVVGQGVGCMSLLLPPC